MTKYKFVMHLPYIISRYLEYKKIGIVFNVEFTCNNGKKHMIDSVRELDEYRPNLSQTLDNTSSTPNSIRQFRDLHLDSYYLISRFGLK